MKEVAHISWSDAGHRGDYGKVLSQVFDSFGIRLLTKDRSSWWTNNIIIYSSLDDFLLSFLAQAIIRSLAGKRTIGLFLRPGGCFRSNVKSRCKFVLFRSACWFSNIEILSIVPYFVDPRFSLVSTRWIFDPQLWDLHYLGKGSPSGDSNSAAQIAEVAQGRRVILALGSHNRTKGFGYFKNLWCSSPHIRSEYIFVLAGRVDPEIEAGVEIFSDQGGVVINRYVPHEELVQLYKQADAIWVCNPPSYDQASGVFGRAVQFGVPTVVRSGSGLEKLAKEIGYPVLAIPYDDPVVATQALQAWCPKHRNTEELVQKIRKFSVEAIEKSLGNVDS